MRGIAVALAGAALVQPGHRGQELLAKIDSSARRGLHRTRNTQAAAARPVGAQTQPRRCQTTAADPERNFFDRPLLAAARTAAPATCASTTGSRRATASSQPVLFTARNGSTLSGHVWATRAGPAKRPGIVITNGSVQAPEELYWFAAQTLAKAGYVVLTFDPQGQGRSDTFGEVPDAERGRARAVRRAAVLRRYRGRARLLLLHARRAVRAAAELRDGHESRGQAGPPRGGRPQRRLQPALGAARPRAHRHRRPLATAPPASRTSASGTRA